MGNNQRATACTQRKPTWLLLVRTLLRANRHQSQLLEQLSASRETLLEAQRISGVGSYRLDLETNAVDFSAEARDIYGFTDADGALSAEACFAHIHDDDRARIQDLHQQNIRGNQFTDMPYRVCRPDGSIRSVVSLVSQSRPRAGWTPRIPTSSASRRPSRTAC